MDPSRQREEGGGQLGGARADFVASLGRKVQGARELIAALRDDPGSRAARDELRRRLHALGAGARMLRFDAMAQSLGRALDVLERGAQGGALREQDVAFAAQVVEDLPALAWGEEPARETPGPASEEGDDTSTLAPTAALVVGGADLAEALGDDGALRSRAFECERTEDAQAGLELARAYAPDVIVVDGDLPRARELLEALLEDPLTEPVPVVVVGTFLVPETLASTSVPSERAAAEAARLTSLGVARTLHKPAAPDALRRACEEAVDARAGRAMRVTLGEPTVEQLADRLADEMKRAFVEGVDDAARSRRVPLGEGTEVLGALWGAIARVQEIVTQKTGGAVRFGRGAPEGAIALAPWLHHETGAAERLGGPRRGGAADVRLGGRRVVVADDDPGVTWFISDLLRTAGCEVHEALDGTTALELAFRVQPELVVSDILMPGIDGFALSRALRRDVALRDTPVILLSWKEDLLQRVRELGASAAAYMRKESDSRSILARVREVLRPRAHIEMRLRGDGEVRGRLDGLTPRLLLELVGAIRVDALVAVRDASHLHEIEIRGGSPRKATRTSADGGHHGGERALASLLGVGAGRFVVSPGRASVGGELTGTLADQLAHPIAAARGALAAMTGARTMNVDRVDVDPEALEEYLRATPEPARGVLARLSKGASPRQMLVAGEVAPSLFEDLVSDLAARGAIRSVVGVDGADLLGPAVAAALAVLDGATRSARALPPNARPSAPAPAAAVIAPSGSQGSPSRSGAPPASRPQVAADGGGPEGASPSSLADAVMREISERTPESGATHASSDPPPLIEPSELRARSYPPAEGGDAPASDELGAVAPDAVVPAATSSEEMVVAAPSSPRPMRAAEPYDDTDPSSAPVEMLPTVPAARTQPLVPRAAPPKVERTVPLATRDPVAPTAPEPAAPKASRAQWAVVLAFLALGLVVGAVIRAAGNDGPEAQPPASAAPTASQGPASQAPDAASPDSARAP